MTERIQDLDLYQRAALRTAPPCGVEIFALGLGGEAGEVLDLLKKHLGHGHELDMKKLIAELGDVLWYVAAIAHHYKINLSEVASFNIEKLKRRYPEGFDKQRSIDRDADLDGSYPKGSGW